MALTPIASDPYFQKRWLRLWLPSESAALHLQMNSLRSANGFRSHTEQWALYTRRPAAEETARRFFRATSASPSFVASERNWSGKIQANEGMIEWNLEVDGGNAAIDSLIPPVVKRTLGISGEFSVPSEKIHVSGEVRIDGSKIQIEAAPALLGTISGARPWTESFWFGSPGLQNPSGAGGFSLNALIFSERPWRFFWESQIRLFRIQYEGEIYESETLWDYMQARIIPSSTGCEFEFPKGGMIFRGRVQCRLKDLTGLSSESTDGTLLHTVACEYADIDVQVYRGQKLEASFSSKGQAFFERYSSEKNPYVVFVS